MRPLSLGGGAGLRRPFFVGKRPAMLHSHPNDHGPSGPGDFIRLGSYFFAAWPFFS